VFDLRINGLAVSVDLIPEFHSIDLGLGYVLIHVVEV
jgi:hypothetical protein